MADIVSNLIGWWKLDEPAGGNAVDSGSGGNTGTATGTVAVPGVVGNFARSFNGTTDVISMGNVAAMNFGTGNFSIFAWVNLAASGSTNAQIVSKIGACAHASWWNLSVGITGFFNVSIGVDQDGGGTNYNAISSDNNTVPPGRWHSIGMVRNGVNLRMYINGVDVKNQDGPGIANISNTANLQIGSGACGAYTGRIDDARIYSRALVAEDAFAIYLTGFRSQGSAVGVVYNN